MHRLDRAAVVAPSCLANYRAGNDTWDDLRSDCREQIKQQLAALQGLRCAYCEREIRLNECHIEHFRRKGGSPNSAFPGLTFVWENLFLSCQARSHCGHYKESAQVGPYDPAGVIKPDEEDPHILLYFHNNGSVLLRRGVTDQSSVGRFNETVRVFGLDNAALKAQRRNAARRYTDSHGPDLDELRAWSSADRRRWLELEREAVVGLPFASTLLHFLERLE